MKINKLEYCLITAGLCVASFSYGHSIQPSLPEPKPLMIEHIYQGEGQIIDRPITMPIKLDPVNADTVKHIKLVLNASQFLVEKKKRGSK